MMEASSLHVTWITKSVYLPQEKNEVDDVNKVSDTVCALKWVRPTTVIMMCCFCNIPVHGNCGAVIGACAQTHPDGNFF